MMCLAHQQYWSVFFFNWFAITEKAISDVISGTLKTIMGFVILTSGAAIIATTLTTFSQLFEHSFHIQGVVPNTDAMAALAQKTTVRRPR